MKKKNIIIFSIVLTFIIIFIGVLLMDRKKQIINNENKQHKYIKGDFNLNLIKIVNDKNNQSNYLISPYSIEIALAMLKRGANGTTKDEITNVIGDRNINDVTVKKRVSVANAAFIKNKYRNYVKKEYYDILRNQYNSEILYDEFKTPKVINDWVNEKTNGMIPSILNNIDENFALGLANALAIDVEWSSPFDCSDTHSEKFTMIDGKIMQTEMMHKTLKYSGYKYFENISAKGVIIPYKKYIKETGEEDYDNGNNLEFIAILPNDDVDSYINNLTDNILDDLLSSAREVTNEFEIKLALPRFKYDYELEDLKNVLKRLGINEAFNPSTADFTNMMSRNEETGNLYVGEAIHKTHIDLNEKGTKAAAVTYFGMKTSGIILEKESVQLTFDKPFIYIIRDKKTNEMLFFGTIYEPNKWQGNTCKE